MVTHSEGAAPAESQLTGIVSGEISDARERADARASSIDGSLRGLAARFISDDEISRVFDTHSEGAPEARLAAVVAGLEELDQELSERGDHSEIASLRGKIMSALRKLDAFDPGV